MSSDDFPGELGDEKPGVKYSGLMKLSGLSSEEAARFKASWASVPADSKMEIPRKLIELCEDNFELDFSAVFRTFLGDTEEDVRELGVRGLWECEERSMIRPLIGLLDDDPSPKVRAAAATALSRFAAMAEDRKLPASDADRIREALLTVVDSEEEEPTVRRRAIEAVSYFDSPAITEMIREAYSSGDTDLKQSSILAMGQTSNVQWLPTVISELDDERAAIRYEAATACGLLGEESSVPHLMTVIEDDDQEVQQAAVRALGSIGGPLGKRALNRCLTLGDEVLEALAQEALEDLAFDDDPLRVNYGAN